MSKNILAIGIILVAALAVSAGMEIATDPEETAPVATTPAVTTSADETATNTTDADNRIKNTPVAATPGWEPRPVEVEAVPVYSLSVTALSNTSADEGDPVWRPNGSNIAVVTMKLRESGFDRDIYIINIPTTGGSEK